MNRSIILLLTLFTAIFSQNLYLVNGHPHSKMNGRFPVELNRYDSASGVITKIKTLNSNGAEFVKIYYDDNLLITCDIAYKDSTTLRVFDLNDINKISDYKLIYPVNYVYVSSNSFLFRNDKSKFLYAFSLFQRLEKNLLTMAVDFESKEFKEVTDEVYSSPILGGITGGYLTGADYLLAYKRNNKISIKSGKGKLGYLKYPEYHNKNYIFNKNDLITLYVNNKHMLVYTTTKFQKRKDNDIGSTDYLIYNKTTDKYSTKTFKGNRTALRGFREWIAGFVGNENMGNKNPGINKYSKERTETGFSVFDRLSFINSYYPGIVFGYNINTDKYFEIITNDADSEILLIENNEVYYRVYDEIYKAEIIGDKVTEGKLLVKDEIVPDIHWAFISR
jgi:hypothetical protein